MSKRDVIIFWPRTIGKSERLLEVAGKIGLGIAPSGDNNKSLIKQTPKQAMENDMEKVVLVEAVDWEGVYVNGLLVCQEHFLMIPKPLEKMFKALDVEFEVIDVPVEVFEEALGNKLPKELWKVTKAMEAQ